MGYTPKKELIVFKIVETLGLASVAEIVSYAVEDLPTTRFKFKEQDVSLICERYRARDLMSIDVSQGVKRYKIAAIPPPFRSCNMANILSMKAQDADNIMKEVTELFPESSEAFKPTKGKVGDYVTVELLIETIDPILGGTPSNVDILKLRRDPATGKPCITPAQFKGWVRSNGLLLNWYPNARTWIAYSPGIPVGDDMEPVDPELIEAEAPVIARGRGAGIQKYEAFATGTKLFTTWRVPLKGQGIKGVEDVEKLFDLCSVSPRRGLGANPYYYGGRVKLLEINKT